MEMKFLESSIVWDDLGNGVGSEGEELLPELFEELPPAIKAMIPTISSMPTIVPQPIDLPATSAPHLGQVSASELTS